MSGIICTECGAVFAGTLNEAADAAFDHAGVHAERDRNPASQHAGLPPCKPAEPNAFGETETVG